jgi:hypothetical protein
MTIKIAFIQLSLFGYITSQVLTALSAPRAGELNHDPVQIYPVSIKIWVLPALQH